MIILDYGLLERHRVLLRDTRVQVVLKWNKNKDLYIYKYSLSESCSTFVSLLICILLNQTDWKCVLMIRKLLYSRPGLSNPMQQADIAKANIARKVKWAPSTFFSPGLTAGMAFKHCFVTPAWACFNVPSPPAPPAACQDRRWNGFAVGLRHELRLALRFFFLFSPRCCVCLIF